MILNLIANKHSTNRSMISKRNKTIGLSWLIGPFAGLVLILIIYAIANFSIVYFGTASELWLLAARIINVVLGLLGVVCVIGTMIGIPVGIVYLTKKESVEGATFDKRSGMQEGSAVPEEVKGWNWGAFGLTWIWGIYHGVWISLLSFVPIANIVIWIMLGLKGSEWAWKARKWESVEAFVAAQNKWKPWGIAWLVVAVLLGFLSAMFEQ